MESVEYIQARNVAIQNRVFFKAKWAQNNPKLHVNRVE